MVQRLCLMSVVGQLLHALKARLLFSDNLEPVMVPADLEEHVRHIIRFSAGGIRACADSDAVAQDEQPKKGVAP